MLAVRTCRTMNMNAFCGRSDVESKMGPKIASPERLPVKHQKKAFIPSFHSQDRSIHHVWGKAGAFGQPVRGLWVHICKYCSWCDAASGTFYLDPLVKRVKEGGDSNRDQDDINNIDLNWNEVKGSCMQADYSITVGLARICPLKITCETRPASRACTSALARDLPAGERQMPPAAESFGSARGIFVGRSAELLVPLMINRTTWKLGSMGREGIC